MKSLHTKNIKTYGQHLLILAVLSFFIPLNVSASGRESGKEAQDTTIASTKTKTKTSARKIFNGYGGGMMLCGSYLFGTESLSLVTLAVLNLAVYGMYLRLLSPTLLPNRKTR